MGTLGIAPGEFDGVGEEGPVRLVHPAMDSTISMVRFVSSGQKRPRNVAMVRRWLGTGMIKGQGSHRGIKGCSDVKPLAAAVPAEVARQVAEDEERRHTRRVRPDRRLCSLGTVAQVRTRRGILAADPSSH